jgi:hypothetical protein
VLLNKKIMVPVFLICAAFAGFAGEKTDSVYQDYLRFLSLQGLTQDPVLMYRSCSSNNWTLPEQHLWLEGYGPSKPLASVAGLSFSLIPPEILFSLNTAYSRHDLSDGSWWQGRGLNGFFSGGFQIKNSWLNVSFYPEIWFALNDAYEILPAVTASEFGYFMGNLDYPQRQGSSPLFRFDWGQTDIRVNGKYLTLGFSNENILWGPSLVNSLMFSDNAPGFPHIDFGLRKTPTPLGDVELRVLRGIVTESDFFDQDEENNKTFISAVTGGWEPKWIPGLVLGLKWSLMANWDVFRENWQLQVFGYEITNTYFGGDQLDQKGSLTINWKFPDSAFEWYFEFFREDYSPSLRYILLAPGHSAGYTLGGQKVFSLSDGRGISVGVEYNQLIQSRDYEIDLGAGGIYYTHHYVYHGFTNGGQMLGAGIGPGSDAQYLMVQYYDSWGRLGLTLQRICWNKMYLYRDPQTITSPEGTGYLKLNTEVSLGLDGFWMVTPEVHLLAQVLFSYNMNFNYIEDNDKVNLYGKIGIQYRK